MLKNIFRFVAILKGTNTYKSCASPLDILYDIQTNIKKVAPNLLEVKSKAKEDIVYTIDMTVGRCERFAGKEGSYMLA